MSIWDSIAAPLIAIVNKVIPDKSAQAEFAAKLQELQVQGALSDELLQLQAITVNQTDINKAEAVNPSMFVAGWRPAVGWICATGLGVQFLVAPLFTWVTTLVGHTSTFPSLDMGTLTALLSGMLGLGAMRSYEKKQGIASSAVGNVK